VGYSTGIASAGAATTITTGKTYVLNQWANYQIRITAGIGAGQVRTVASNTAGAASVVTVSVAWTTNPDATSTFIIEGNDDSMYLLGNGAVTAYKFSISANTWATMAPGAARAAAPGAGLTADWIDGVEQSEWYDATYTNHFTSIPHQNGRYIYSMRGGATATLDILDLAAVTWLSSPIYGNQAETFASGACSTIYRGMIYLQKDATGRMYKFDVGRNVLEPYYFLPIPQGVATPGRKLVVNTVRLGDEIPFLFALSNTRQELVKIGMI